MFSQLVKFWQKYWSALCKELTSWNHISKYHCYTICMQWNCTPKKLPQIYASACVQFWIDVGNIVYCSVILVMAVHYVNELLWVTSVLRSICDNWIMNFWWNCLFDCEVWHLGAQAIHVRCKAVNPLLVRFGCKFRGGGGRERRCGCQENGDVMSKSNRCVFNGLLQLFLSWRFATNTFTAK